MPELPDVTVYLEALRPRTVGQPLQALDLENPFVLRSVSPPVSEVVGRTVRDLRRLGKRIVLCLSDDYFIVIHLMIAGRLRWRTPNKKIGGKLALARFEFPTGVLWLTEAGSKRRASIHLVHGEEALAEQARGGIEVLDASLADFARMLRIESHTLKRSLTDPTLFSGIGNAYSDEILHHARLSPVKQTKYLTDEEIERLYHSTQVVLKEWIERLRTQTGEGFPEEVTAFRPEMATHGKFGKPCPVCGSPIQRIVHADNETNYCPTCQTGGKLLADRSLSRLLREDWPRSLDEMEEHKQQRRA